MTPLFNRHHARALSWDLVLFSDWAAGRTCGPNPPPHHAHPCAHPEALDALVHLKLYSGTLSLTSFFFYTLVSLALHAD